MPDETPAKEDLALERTATDQQLALESTATGQPSAVEHTQAMQQEPSSKPPPAKRKRRKRPTAVGQFNISDLPVELRKKIHDPSQPVVQVQEVDEVEPLPDLNLGQEGATKKAFNLDKKGRPKRRTGVGSFDISSLKDLMKDD